MERIWLSEAERERFARYLLECAEADEGLIRQLSKLDGGIGGKLEEKLRAEVIAERIVAAKLRSIENVEYAK